MQIFFVMGGFKEENNNSDLVTVPNNTDQVVTKCRSTIGDSFQERCISLTSAPGDYVTSVWTLRERSATFFRRGSLASASTLPTLQHEREAVSGTAVSPGVFGAVWFAQQVLIREPLKSSQL